MIDTVLLKLFFKIISIIGTYQGGGYVTNLGRTYREAQDILDELQAMHWIDKHTRVLFVEFNLWNPNTNLFSFITISLEFLITGSLVNWDDIKSVELYRYVYRYSRVVRRFFSFSIGT